MCLVNNPCIDFSLEKGYPIPIFLFHYVEISFEITLPSGSQYHTALFCFHALGEFGPRLAYRSRDQIPRMTRRTTHHISLPTQTNAHKTTTQSRGLQSTLCPAAKGATPEVRVHKDTLSFKSLESHCTGWGSRYFGIIAIIRTMCSDSEGSFPNQRYSSHRLFVSIFHHSARLPAE